MICCKIKIIEVVGIITDRGQTTLFKYTYHFSPWVESCSCNTLVALIHPPVSQWTPVNPIMQEQMYPFTASVQLAPLLHGAPRHSSMSAKYHDDVLIRKLFYIPCPLRNMPVVCGLSGCVVLFFISLAFEYTFVLPMTLGTMSLIRPHYKD